MLFFSQDRFEHVDFVLPLNKNAWYHPKQKNWEKSRVQAHPRSQEHDAAIDELFGHSKENEHIAQIKRSKNGHWTFLLHDAQELQLVFSEAKELIGFRFRHNHMGSEAAELVLNALQKQGHDIFAPGFLENNMEFTGSKEFIRNAKETLRAHIANRTKALAESATATQVAAPPSMAPVSLSMTVSQSAYVNTNHAWLPETHGDLLGITSAWADYHYTRLINDMAAGKVQSGSPAYTARAAQVRLLDLIQSTLSGMQDEVTKQYPTLSPETLSRIRKEIGPAGENPYATGAKEPDWRFVALNLGIKMPKIAQQPADAPTPRGPSVPPPAFARGPQPPQFGGPGVSV